jgi:transposase
MVRPHAMVAAQAGDAGDDELRVLAGIETDRGPWVAALVAAGYQVFAVNSLQAARYRERHVVSGAKSDADAHVLADMVRTDAHQHLELLSEAPTGRCRETDHRQVSAALRRARRRDVPGRAARIREALRSRASAVPRRTWTSPVAGTCPIAARPSCGPGQRDQDGNGGP